MPTPFITTGQITTSNRVYKDTATDSQIENLKAKIYDGKATRADITRVTRRLGDEIAAVYGFDIPRQKKNIERAR